jgi:type III secretion protein T
MTPVEEISSLANIEVYVIASAIAMARMMGLVLVLPAFTRLGVTGIIRAGISIALSLPLVPFIALTVAPEQVPIMQIAGYLAKEVVAGVVLGLFLGVPLWAAEVAGEIMDVQRGVTFGDIADPTSGGSNNVTGNFFSLLVVALFFASGGLQFTMKTLYASYEIWPVTSTLPIFAPGTGQMFLELLDDLFGLGFLLVSPIVIAFLLTDLSLAFVARAAPQMNIFVLSLAVKNLLFVFLIVLYGVFLLSYMKDNLGEMTKALPQLEKLSGKSSASPELRIPHN